MALKPHQATGEAVSSDDRLTGPWISHDRVPDVLKEFDLNRDPMIRAQLLDMKKSEARRRHEQGERSDTRSSDGSGHKTRKNGSRMIEGDGSEPILTPPPEMRRSADRQSFNYRWMIEKRDAAFARADLKVSLPERNRDRNQSKFQTPSP